MFVMLSVHTTTTVRERKAGTVKNKVNNQSCTPSTGKYCNDITFSKQDINHWKNYCENTLIVPRKSRSIDQIFQSITSQQPTTLIPSSVEKGASILTPSKLANAPTSAPKFLLSELNNFKKPPTVQVPVATILNDLSPVPAPVKVKNNKNNNYLASPMTPTGLQNNTPDIKAMRYYRLWIYTCNAVLLMAVIVFCGVAGKVLVSDYKRLLVSGLNLTQPSFIYAYLALLVQSGFLQLVGCLGALRLSEKLLNAYWLLLLILLVGDAILGIFWIFKFDRVMQELQPMLKYRLAHEYGNSVEFTELWDRLQRDGRCCGVGGPQDYTLINRTYPTSCCTQDITEKISIAKRPMASAVVYRNDDITILNTIRDQHKNLTDIADIALSHVITAARGGGGGSGGGGSSGDTDISSSGTTSSSGSENRVTIAICRAVYQQGCAEKLMSWLRSTADILFVLGYCVIAFLKLCFLGILRYEIKEMIQKIKLLQTEMASAILQGECSGITSIGEQTQPQLVNPLSINGGLQYGEAKIGNRDRNLVDSIESERESLLVHENTPKLLKHKQLYSCINEHSAGATAGDSDTNSNCALIVDEIANNPLASSSLGMGAIGGRRESYSFSTAQQHQIPLEPLPTSSSTGATKRTINGNNNYELTEFDTKAPNYRRSNAPTVTKI